MPPHSMTHTVSLPNTSFLVPHGTNLLHALRSAGILMDAPCGGRGHCGKCRLTVDGASCLACETVVDRDMTVLLPRTGTSKILMNQGTGPLPTDGSHAYALAFDVGTTTVVGFLLRGSSGEVLARSGVLNPQTAYGGDVISRIQYRIQNGIGPLRDSIRRTLRRMTFELCELAGISPREIGCTALVGNTAMHHLLLGIDPTLLTRPPYMPACREAIRTASPDWLPVSEQGELRILPNIAGFVGADTAACLLTCAFDTLEPVSLMLDIGTNGELVLGNGKRRIACSTAAGPAFEGAGIFCGMRAAEGAIDGVSIRNGTLACRVIGGGEAKGICGSGLLDAVACMLELGMLRMSGRMDGSVGDPGLWTEADGCLALRLADGVVLTQKDVRQLQLAKGAIRAGIELLSERYGIAAEQIERVYLAGAFGNDMSPDSACAIGLIPPSLRDRILPIGNAAGRGACMSALSEENFRRGCALADATEFLELAALPDFQDRYVDSLPFGEEDM